MLLKYTFRIFYSYSSITELLLLDISFCIHRLNILIVVRWCRASLRYQNNLDAFETLCISGSSGFFSVLRPAKLAVRLCMYTIIYIKAVCHLAVKLDLDCFQSLCFSACSAHRTIRYRILPAKGLDVGAVGSSNFPLYIFKYIAIFLGIRLYVRNSIPPNSFKIYTPPKSTILYFRHAFQSLLLHLV